MQRRQGRTSESPGRGLRPIRLSLRDEVKLAEIRIGEEYAVRLDWRRLLLEGCPVNGLQFAYGAYRGTAASFEKNEAGRTLVHVEFTAHVPRRKEAREPNPDGTWTIWEGYVVDAEDQRVQDAVTFDVLVQSSQVVSEWTEAVVQQSVRSLDGDWQSFDGT